MILPSKAEVAVGFREFLAIIPVSYILTLMWWFPDGSKYVPGIVGGALLLYGLCGKWPLRNGELKSKQAPFLLACWFFVAVSIASYAINGGSWTELRALLVIAIYISFFWGVSFRAVFFKVIVSVAALGFIVLTYFQYLKTGGRIGGFINPIPYATAVGSLAMLFLTMTFFSKDAFWQRSVFMVIFVFLVFALFMTKTRGVVIPVFVVSGGLLFTLILKNKRNRLLKLLVIVSALVGFAVIAGSTFLNDRVKQTYNEYEQLSENNYNGSFGIRLQLWIAADDLVVQKPIIGHGDNYREALKELYLANNLAESLYLFNALHFHNQFVDTVVKKGILGGVALLLLFGAAVRMALITPRENWQWYGGLSIVLVYAGASLTDVPLLHAHTIFLFFGLCFFSSAIRPDTIRTL